MKFSGKVWSDQWPKDDLIKFRVNSGKWVSGSKVNLLSPDIAIWFDCCLLAVLCCHLATENVIKLLFWPTATSQHGTGFVVLCTTACSISKSSRLGHDPAHGYLWPNRASMTSFRQNGTQTRTSVEYRPNWHFTSYITSILLTQPRYKQKLLASGVRVYSTRDTRQVCSVTEYTVTENVKTKRNKLWTPPPCCGIARFLGIDQKCNQVVRWSLHTFPENFMQIGPAVCSQSCWQRNKEINKEIERKQYPVPRCIGGGITTDKELVERNLRMAHQRTVLKCTPATAAWITARQCPDVNEQTNKQTRPITIARI